MSERRRLPMIQPASEADDVTRPAWQWVLFGAGLILAGWAGLALLVSPIGTYLLARHLGAWSTQDELSSRLATAPAGMLRTIALENLAMHLVALGLASFAGSVVVGRWSPGRAVHQAAAAGSLVAIAAISMAALAGVTAGGESDALWWAFAVVLPWTALLAATGAWWGGKKKQTLVGPG